CTDAQSGGPMKAFSIRERSQTPTSNWLKPVRSVLGGLIAASLTTTSPAVTVSATAEITGSQAVAPAAHSAGVSEILKLVDAKVDAEVIKAYIHNSPVPYNPNAAEIIG